MTFNVHATTCIYQNNMLFDLFIIIIIKSYTNYWNYDLNVLYDSTWQGTGGGGGGWATPSMWCIKPVTTAPKGSTWHRGSNMAGWESSISMEVYGELSIAMFTER